MTNEFQVYKDMQNQFRWRLVAGNGEIIAVASEGYARRADAVHGIELLKENDIAHAEIFSDKAGQYRWRQKATNGRIIATGGEGFTRLDDCKASLGLVHTVAPDAPVDDRTRRATSQAMPPRIA